MRMQEFSQATGLSEFTIRYYEKAGILRTIARTASGLRDFSADDLAWVTFIRALLETGMTIAGVKNYAELKERGESTLGQRVTLLDRLSQSLEDEMARKQASLDLIKKKIRRLTELMNVP